MTQDQINVFGMVGVDLYVKVIPAVMMLCHGLNKRDRYALRFLIIIPPVC